ncbi:MAG: hypothetical protein ACOC2U_01080 [bacterium]
MLTNYLRNCEVRFAGVKPSLFFGEAVKGWDLTFSGNTITAITPDEVGDAMQEFQADINTVQFTSEGEWSKSGFETQTLTARFSTASTELDESIKNLKKALPCGVFVIYIDNNKNGWLVGLAKSDEDFYNDYFRTLTTNYTTGMSIEDVDEGNTLNIELSRMAATSKYKLDSDLTASILDGTATFIDFATA